MIVVSIYQSKFCLDPRRAQTAQVDTRNRTRRGAKTTRTSLKIGSGSQSDAGSGANIAV